MLIIEQEVKCSTKEHIMSTIRKNWAMGAGELLGVGPVAAVYGHGYGATAARNVEALNKLSADGLAILKRIALFVAAPFFGLAYIVAFPFVGLGIAVWIGARALIKYAAARKTAAFVKWLGMLVLAPLLGLALVILLPVTGAALLAWIGGRTVAG